MKEFFKIDKRLVEIWKTANKLEKESKLNDKNKK